MMSLERFLKECEALIYSKEPFLAYRHQSGFGLFRTDTIYTEQYVLRGQRRKDGKTYTLRARTAFERDNYLRGMRRDGDRVLDVRVEKEPRKVKSSIVKAIRKTIDLMRRDPRVHDLQVVEFDGYSVTTDGPGELLTRLKVSGGSE